MVHTVGIKMPGRLNSLKPRKKKSSSRKASTTRRRCMKSPKTQPASQSSSVMGGYSSADGPPETHSHISCECHQTTGRRRCSASPKLDGQEGKENELRTRFDLDSCSMSGVWDKQESEDMECEETSKNIFPDDDSNQILPVEQFFGNLDGVQDFPQRSYGISGPVDREHRRRHYYAPEDSDEEEAGLSSMQRADRGDT